MSFLSYLSISFNETILFPTPPLPFENGDVVSQHFWLLEKGKVATTKEQEKCPCPSDLTWYFGRCFWCYCCWCCCCCCCCRCCCCWMRSRCDDERTLSTTILKETHHPTGSGSTTLVKRNTSLCKDNTLTKKNVWVKTNKTK